MRLKVICRWPFLWLVTWRSSPRRSSSAGHETINHHTERQTTRRRCWSFWVDASQALTHDTVFDHVWCESPQVTASRKLPGAAFKARAVGTVCDVCRGKLQPAWNYHFGVVFPNHSFWLRSGLLCFFKYMLIFENYSTKMQWNKKKVAHKNKHKANWRGFFIRV